MTDFSFRKKIFKILFCTVFTIAGVSVNYFCSLLAGLIAFPLYLDSVLTIAVTALCGLVPGLICAFCSNLLLAIFANTGILFCLCHISTVIISYLVFKNERNKNAERGHDFLLSTDSFMWAGFISAIANSILGDTISYFFYSANTAIPQVDNAVQGIYIVTKNLSFAAYFGGTITNLVDKLVSATICLFIYRGVKIIQVKHS